VRSWLMTMVHHRGIDAVRRLSSRQRIQAEATILQARTDVSDVTSAQAHAPSRGASDSCRPARAAGGAASGYRACVLRRLDTGRDRGEAQDSARHCQESRPAWTDQAARRATQRARGVAMSDGPCEYDDDAAGWVLGALSPLEAERIAAHLESCASCRAEVTKLTEAAERLGDVVPLSTPLPELRERVMASVRAEASLFKVADADAAPPERSLPPRRSRRNAGVLAAIFASLAAGVAAIVLVAADQGSPTASPRTVAGKVTSEGGSGARALVRTGPHAGTLIVTRLAAPPAGRVYQAWINPARLTSDPDRSTVLSTRFRRHPGPAAVPARRRRSDRHRRAASRQPNTHAAPNRPRAANGASWPDSPPLVTPAQSLEKRSRERAGNAPETIESGDFPGSAVVPAGAGRFVLLDPCLHQRLQELGRQLLVVGELDEALTGLAAGGLNPGLLGVS